MPNSKARKSHRHKDGSFTQACVWHLPAANCQLAHCNGPCAAAACAAGLHMHTPGSLWLNGTGALGQSEQFSMQYFTGCKSASGFKKKKREAHSRSGARGVPMPSHHFKYVSVKKNRSMMKRASWSFWARQRKPDFKKGTKFRVLASAIAADHH